MAEVLRMPDVGQRLHDLGATPVGDTPADTATFIRQETERWRKVIRGPHQAGMSYRRPFRLDFWPRKP